MKYVIGIILIGLAGLFLFLGFSSGVSEELSELVGYLASNIIFIVPVVAIFILIIFLMNQYMDPPI